MEERYYSEPEEENMRYYQYPEPPRKSSGGQILTVILAVLLTFLLAVGATVIIMTTTLGFRREIKSKTDIQQIDPDYLIGEVDIMKIVPRTAGDEEAEKLEAKKLEEIVRHLYESYYRNLTRSDIYKALGLGLIEQQDSPYTYYLTAEDYTQIRTEMGGSYVGIGASVNAPEPGRYVIFDVLENSPAEKAGLLADDEFVSVDNMLVTSFTDLNDLANHIKGKEGTAVTIEFYRPSTKENYTVQIIRANVNTVDVTVIMINDQVGYCYMREFTGTFAAQFEKGMHELMEKGAKQIVFDLRENPGGDAHQLVLALDMLLPGGVIATLKGRSEGKPIEDVWESTDWMIVPKDVEFVCLVSNRSASAAELFAGALRDHGRTVIIGEQTYGKGSGTAFFPLADGSAVNITIFQYYLPSGELIEGRGLKPNLEISLPQELRSTSVRRLTRAEDTQLKAALDYLGVSGLYPTATPKPTLTPTPGPKTTTPTAEPTDPSTTAKPTVTPSNPPTTVTPSSTGKATPTPTPAPTKGSGS